MEFFKPVEIDEGKKKIDSRLEYTLELEEVDILEARGRIIAKDLVSRETVPNFNKSTVDGYAINSKDSYGASSTIPTLLTLVERVNMGEVPQKDLKGGETTYVPTGAMLAEGSDSVVMIENAEALDEETVMVYRPVSKGENVVRRGDDIKEGQVLIEAGKRLNSHDIGVLASQGENRVKVYRKLTASVISTGDEIVDIDEEITKGKVRDINSYVIAARLKELGVGLKRRVIAKDDYDLIRRSVEESLEDSDIVIMSGGSSVGEKDYTHDIIDSFDGEGVFIHGVSVKPGKPTIVGKANKKMVFGLPGHPSSSIILFDIFVKHTIEKIQNIRATEKVAYCEMDTNFPSSSGKRTYQTVKVYEEEGKLKASPIFAKSAMISMLSKANGYIELGPDEEGIYKGEVRRVVYF